MSKTRLWNLPIISAVTLALGGCMSVSPDGGMEHVAALTQARIGVAPVKIADPKTEADTHERLKGLLRRPLTSARAVQIALLHNRHLQAAYNDLGIAEAQFVQAALPPSPTVSVARIATSLEREIERQVLVNLLGLITQPTRQKIAEARIRQAQMRAASETLKIAGQARNAYYRAVASRQLVGYLQQANTNARIVSQLFRKLGESGAVNKLDQAREHVFYAELAAQLAKARMDHAADLERLARTLGLSGGEARIKLPATLPSLPRNARVRKDVEREAIRDNISIAIAKAELDATVQSLGLSNATRFVNVLELRGIATYESARSRDPVTGIAAKEVARRRGIELELQIPIYDFGATRQREAEQTYARAFNLLAAQGIDIRSLAREAYVRYRGAYDLARHYRRAIVPLRKIISDENLLRYNAMIVDIFPVLSEARQSVSSNMQAITALRDFWLAEADLRAAVVGSGVSGDGGAAAEPVMAAGGRGESH